MPSNIELVPGRRFVYMIFASPSTMLTNRLTDSRAALLRVHLPGHHVVPLLVFRAGSRPWHYSDRGPSGIRSLHFPGCLVSIIFDYHSELVAKSVFAGNSVCAIPRQKTSAILVKCSSGTPSGRGGSPRACSS